MELNEAKEGRNLADKFTGLWLRVENRAFPGTPDVHFVCGGDGPGNGLSGWAEMKVGQILDGQLKPLKKLEANQINFLRNWSDLGNACLMLFYRDFGSGRNSKRAVKYVAIIDGKDWRFMQTMRKDGCSVEELRAKSAAVLELSPRLDMSIHFKSIYS